MRKIIYKLLAKLLTYIAKDEPVMRAPATRVCEECGDAGMFIPPRIEGGYWVHEERDRSRTHDFVPRLAPPPLEPIRGRSRRESAPERG